MQQAPWVAHELAMVANDAKRALLQRFLVDFVAWAWPIVTGAPFVANQIALRMIAVLQRVVDGELSRVLIAMPPGVGKSTLLACYSGWRFARDAGHRAIHAGHSFEGLAKTESMRVRRLVENIEFRRLFQGVALRDDENTAGLWATTRNGVYIALGTDAGVTGKRVKEAVLDDPMDAHDRFSKAKKDGLWAWYSESLLSRLDGDNAPIIVVHQRLDRDDLIGKLIEAGGLVENGGEWFLLELPAETDDGELLAPNVLSREKLDALKAPGAMGSAAYATQYLQRPSDDSNAAIKRVWWRFHRPVHVAEHTPRPSGCITADLAPAVETPSHFSHVVIAVDMTFGATGAKNDYAVIQAWGSLGAGRYLLAQWRAKATQLVQQEAIRQMRREYPGAAIIVEKAAGGQGAVELLTAEGFTGVIGVTTGGKGKDQRMSMVTPAIEAGNVFLPLGASWVGDFVEELAGATKHDDAKDACAYALARLALKEHHTGQVFGGWGADDDVDDPIHDFSGPRIHWLDGSNWGDQ